VLRVEDMGEMIAAWFWERGGVVVVDDVVVVVLSGEGITQEPFLLISPLTTLVIKK